MEKYFLLWCLSIGSVNAMQTPSSKRLVELAGSRGSYISIKNNYNNTIRVFGISPKATLLDVKQCLEAVEQIPIDQQVINVIWLMKANKERGIYNPVQQENLLLDNSMCMKDVMKAYKTSFFSLYVAPFVVFHEPYAYFPVENFYYTNGD